MKLGQLKSIELCPDADPEILDYPRLFPKLTSVILSANDKNKAYLYALAKYYPNIKLLSIRQSVNFSNDELRSLKKFSKLDALGLICPVENPTLLNKSIPKRIKVISLTEPKALGNLPNLQILNIGLCSIKEQDLENFHAPKLSNLNLTRISMTSELINQLGKYKNLKRIFLEDCSITQEQQKELEKVTSAKVHNLSDPSLNTMPSPCPQEEEKGTDILTYWLASSALYCLNSLFSWTPPPSPMALFDPNVNWPVRTPIWSYLDTDSLHLSEPVSKLDKSLLRKVKILYVEPGCDPTMFDKRGTFHKLTVVCLYNNDNTPYLKGLAKNYSTINSLSIVQPDDPLSVDGIRYIKNFTHLEYLSIFCKVKDSSELEHAIPKRVGHLELANPESLHGNFPKLRKLDLTNCHIDADFFDQFSAPNLSILTLTSVSISSSAIEKLRQFKNLIQLNADISSIDEAQRNQMRSVTAAKVYDYRAGNLNEWKKSLHK